jgi:isoleucyl-tRNA synthetase
VLGDYVTLDAGTGAVHTAPGHGSDDFTTGIRYGLDIYAPVGPGGHFLETVELFAGQRVFDANPNIEQALKERARLWHRQTFTHQYPHCWRCHNPVIFLATSQWFIRLDGDGVIGPERRTLRQAGLESIDRDVTWIPAWGRDRLFNMLSNRPDWCISRQRAWGVPIPAVDCTKCGEALLTGELVERAASVFDEYGADAWYERPIEEFIPPGLTCPSCGNQAFERERDILDVWFDSGSSHEAVLPFRADLTWPADIYLEGSDQHRGWFQSSLLVGLGTRGRPPFRQVLTHGFLIDVDGRKMSKSLGNVIDPDEVVKKVGSDAFRLWIAGESTVGDDFRINEEKIAGAGKFLQKLANVAAFVGKFPQPPTKPAHLHPSDAWILGELDAVTAEATKAYADLDFFTPANGVRSFVWNTFAPHYLEMVKGRAYNGDPAACWTLHQVLRSVLLLLAPITPFCSHYYGHGVYGLDVHRSAFPTPGTQARDPATTDAIVAFNGQVWKAKQEKGLSLGAPIDGVAVPAPLKPFEAELKEMHKLS